MARFPVSSLSPSALAAARRSGRVLGVWVYATKAQRDAASAALTSLGRPVGRGGGGAGARGGAFAGWSSSVVVATHRMILTQDVRCEKFDLFGTVAGHTAVPGISDASSVRIQGIRVELSVPFAATKLRWAVGAATSVSAGDKSVPLIETLAGAVGGHELVAEGWYTVGLGGLDPVKREGVVPAPSLVIVTAFENASVTGSTEHVVLKVHITVLKPGVAGAIHAI